MIEFTLKEAFQTKFCPVCRAIDQEMHSFFKWFELENYHEYSSILEFYEHSYICSRHRKILLKLGDKLNNTFELIVEKDLEFFAELEKHSSKKIAKEVKKTKISCRFCIEERKIEEHVLKSFLNNIQLINLYLNSNSILCKKHLVMFLENSKNKEIQNKMIEKTKNFLKNTHDLIEAYFQKIDFNSQEKPTTQERNAFLEALRFYSRQFEPENKK